MRKITPDSTHQETSGRSIKPSMTRTGGGSSSAPTFRATSEFAVRLTLGGGKLFRIVYNNRIEKRKRRIRIENEGFIAPQSSEED